MIDELMKEAPELARLQQQKLDELIEQKRAANEFTVTRSSHTEKCLGLLITQDRRMIELKEVVRKLHGIQDTVLIIGESGTGKELIAKALHGNRRGALAFINCAAMPSELIESELFGHTRGAFTGADRDKEGMFTYCAEGTLVLDEIGDMPIDSQAKLLRVLQSGKVRKVGDTVERDNKCRVVASTHHNLELLVNEKKFRLDLYARLVTFPLVTIPLRERLGDVIPIVKFLDEKDGTSSSIIEELPMFYNKPDYWNNPSGGISPPYSLNVRDLERMVRQYKVLGKIL